MAYNQGQIDQMFQQYLGRPGTDAEHSFLSDYVNKGDLTPYQIGQYLQSTPEALQGRQGQQLGQYQNLLTQNNGQVLKQAADAANASFAQNGRQFSSGQGNAVIQAGQQLAAQQSPMIAAFYGNNAQQLNSQYAQNGQDALSRAYGLEDSATQYSRDKEMWQRQADYNSMMLKTQNRMNQQNALIGGAIGLGGSLLGAAGNAGGFGSLFSDRRLKKNIEHIGSKNGHNLYRFDFKREEFPALDLPVGKQIGVMADEVERTSPQAVGERLGFKTVDYVALGLR